MEGQFTVYFDDPFWIGVCEIQDETGYRVARVVFGSEPSEAELYQFIQANYTRFEFSQPVKTEKRNQQIKNYKRVQREVRQALRQKSPGTKAQQALKQALTENKQERQRQSRQERLVEAETQFHLRQQKKREKHRGH